MQKVLLNLMKVKSLITLIVSGGLLYGFCSGMISSEQFMQISVMVFTFYFAKQAME